MDYDKAPKSWLTNFGLAKGYAATGDKTAALKYADTSIQLATYADAKNYVERFRKTLAEGKDVSGF